MATSRYYDYNKYSAGNIRYGGTGAPNLGMKLDPMGYKERSLKHKAKTNAILRRIKAKKSGRLMSSDYLKPKDTA